MCFTRETIDSISHIACIFLMGLNPSPTLKLLICKDTYVKYQVRTKTKQESKKWK